MDGIVQIMTEVLLNALPHAMGNEEETGLLVTNLQGDLEEPHELAERLDWFMPAGMVFAGEGQHLFLQNGGLIYPGGAHDRTQPDRMDIFTNIERATAEQSGPEAMPAAIGAHEKLLVEVVKGYVERTAGHRNQPASARIQRRVVDAGGSRKASHDSFGVDHPEQYFNNTDKKMQRYLFLSMLAVESFMYGAGYVTAKGTRFAQKLGGLVQEESYGYHGSMMRTVNYEDTGPRIEKRCSDINLSPWAIQTRFGHTALLLTLLKTPLAAKLAGQNPVSHPLQDAKRFNFVSLDGDGGIIAEPLNYEALDFVERFADMITTDLGRYTFMPIEYELIASDIKKYCEDFRAVLDGKEPYTLLADRADHAAKFMKIAEKMAIDRREGKSRSFNDVRSIRDDMLYDYIGITAKPGQAARVKYGYGYKRRSEGGFRATPNDRSVEKAFWEPPTDTRALVRSELIQKYQLSDVKWNMIKLPGYTHELSLRGPRDTTLSPAIEQIVKLYAVGRD